MYSIYALDSLSDESWQKVDEHIRKTQRALGVSTAEFTKEDLRNFLRGISYRQSCGVKWQELPAEYGNYKVVYQHFRGWLQAGLLDKVVRLLKKEDRKRTKAIINEFNSRRLPEPSDFHKALYSITSLRNRINEKSKKIPFAYDFLTDDERSVIISVLQSINEKFCLFVKKSKDSYEEAVRLLEAEERKTYLNQKEITRNFIEASNDVCSIERYISYHVKNVANVIDNLTDEERAEVYTRLKELPKSLDVLINDLNEIDELNG